MYKGKEKGRERNARRENKGERKTAQTEERSGSSERGESRPGKQRAKARPGKEAGRLKHTNKELGGRGVGRGIKGQRACRVEPFRWAAEQAHNNVRFPRVRQKYKLIGMVESR